MVVLGCGCCSWFMVAVVLGEFGDFLSLCWLVGVLAGGLRFGLVVFAFDLDRACTLFDLRWLGLV